MESPVTIVKSAFSPGNILKGVAAVFVAALVFDALGITNWLLFPYSTAKAKFMPVKAA